MSSIFGIIYKNGRPVSPEEAAAITQAVQHAGVGKCTPWIDDNVLIGQCPHAPAASIPADLLIADELLVAADVRIDNRGYMLDNLPADRSYTDQQLLLSAYRKWGMLALHHLEGEYAFCAWDIEQRRLFLATDHMGFRPLYYYNSDDVFIFSSSLKAVLAVKPKPHVFNAECLINYHFRQGDAADTYTKDVYAFCGGNYLTLHGRKIHMAKYWNPLPGRYKLDSLDDCTEALKELLLTAIRNRIMPDRPIGITLSGGLDSSSIACLLARELFRQNKPLYSFSSVLSENAAGNDERAYIDIIGRRYPNIIQTYVDAPDAGPFEGTLDAFSCDETIPNSFFYMDHAILRAAREEGVGILFTGYGGDHWVSWQGNPVIYNMLCKGYWMDAYDLIMEFAETENIHPFQVAKRELAPHTLLYQTLRGAQKKKMRDTALHPSFLRKYGSALDFRPVRDITAFMTDNIISGRTGQFLGMLNGRNNAYGMESAVPLLDRHIVELMMDMPEEAFIFNGHKRSLLRHTMEGVLPEDILWRKDKGRYSPDFPQRITAGLPKAAEVMRNQEYAMVFDRYLSKEAIRRLAGGDELSMIRMTQGIICSMVLTSLQKNGYVFDDNFS
ncbi:asparagine synthase-related protein [Chitinophaga agri]|uniref:asparagine synthase (glutamine-hydrolyzing) n=1 Tax=Chitinophaga agri TaxID=2703787 RepID=A0A6B9Z8D1_9BACT|nr:asparagine synthase-related protein [Chitinophaga agri]QHS58129.1 hypothetical protein GWR21_00520 [Chitinophaga agri]